MKKQFLLLVLLFVANLAFAQEEIEYKEYSYAEFFQMIADEEDSIFKLSDAVIMYDSLTDEIYSGIQKFNKVTQFSRTDSLYVNKALDLNNVQFIPLANFSTNMSAKVGLINHITFKEKVILRNSHGYFYNNTFKGGLSLVTDNRIGKLMDLIQDEFINPINEASNIGFYTFNEFYFNENLVNKSIKIGFESDDEKISTILDFAHNTFDISQYSWIRLKNVWRFSLQNNSINGNEELSMAFSNVERLSVEKNVFEATVNLGIAPNINDVVDIESNTFKKHVRLEVNNIQGNHNISWRQWQRNAFNDISFLEDFMIPSAQKMTDSLSLEEINSKNYENIMTQKYMDVFRVQNNKAYRNDIKFRSAFYNRYKESHDTENANLVYMEIKDLETQRLAYLYEQNPSFKTYFKWRINQFLKAFSAYGTEPERAIIFSVYVILAFAFVYLFFPNHWDSHGKDRILHRYQFFLKYLNKDAGMHDVYLEGKKDELAHYDGFKNFFIENGKTVPKFFLATALPLYRWSTASTRGSSWFLQKIDIFKGKWSDLPPPQRAAKTVLLTLVFVVALTYDILIKMLNALMLSINTFTTLGFGEIPIKGLPRYLAIIQGFIGWFMLTIFSVSLISQLLN